MKKLLLIITIGQVDVDGTLLRKRCGIQAIYYAQYKWLGALCRCANGTCNKKENR